MLSIERNFRSYQPVATNFMLSRPRGMLWADVGFGKTVIVETVANVGFASGRVIRMLVVATKAIATDTWQDEVGQWEHLCHLRDSVVSYVGMSPKERERELFGKRPTRIDTINFDQLIWLERELTRRGEPLSQYYDLVVFDEITKLKDPTGRRFKAASRMTQQVPYVWGLTGTPAAEGYAQMWAPMYLIDNGYRLGVTLKVYQDTFFVNINGRFVLQRGAKERIHQLLGDVVLTLSAEEYGNVLPDVHFNPRKIHLSDHLYGRYLKFEREMVMEMQQGSVVAANPGVLLNKCLQFTSGAVYLSDELGQRTSQWEELHSMKLDALESMVDEQNGKPLLCGIQYVHEAERIARKFERIAVFMDASNVDRVKPEWNAGRVPLLVTNPKSCAHGLNLQRGGNAALFYTLPWSREDFEQLYGRLARPGQTDDHNERIPVDVHALLCDGTVDNLVWETQKAKGSVQSALKKAMSEQQLSIFNR